MPHNHDIITKPITDHTNTFTSPNRRAIKPVSGMEIALATANEVITQVPCVVAAPKSPAITGTATLAMVVSSTSINTAKLKAKVTNTSRMPCKGG